MLYNTIKNIAVFGVGGAVALGLIWVALKFALPILLPFIIAYAISYAVRYGAVKLRKRTRMNENVLRGILLLAGVAGLAAFIWFGISALMRELREAVAALSQSLGSSDSLVEKLQDAISKVAEKFGFNEELNGSANEIITNAVSQLSTFIAGNAANFATSFPGRGIAAVITVASLFYFTFGYEKTSAAVKAILPEKHKKTICAYAASAVRGLGRFVRSYCIIIGITFIELLLGFLILRVDHAIILALMISVIDILPILGVGTVLIPWAAVSFLMGNSFRALGLLIIMAVIFLLRQPIESKVIGRGAGIHPIFALAAVYTGFRISGIFGMIIAPTILTAACVMWQERKKVICNSEK